MTERQHENRERGDGSAGGPSAAEGVPARYARQALLPGIGAEAQARLRDAHAIIVGCGALGCGVADHLARAGVGTLTIIDRDVVETSNLQRQCLFDQRHAGGATPKAEAARQRLGEINSEVRVIAHVAEFNARTWRSLVPEFLFARGAPAEPDRPPVVLIDGCDNFPTRLLLNDIAVAHSIPYIYAGVIATRAMVMPVPPGRPGACLRCLLPEPPAPGVVGTCDTVGVLGPAVGLATAIQASEALKVLLGLEARVSADLTEIDLWSNSIRRIPAASLRDPACACCAAREFTWMDHGRAPDAATLCGRDAIQLAPTRDGALDLGAIADRLRPVGTVDHNQFLVRFTPDQSASDASRDQRASDAPPPACLTIFRDGRVLVHGAASPERARAIRDRYLGV
ncbi:MAG: ThiF family adenylyltransferase [Phycisphaerales bacterium]